MNRSLLEFAALVAIAVFASACAPGKIASGCRSDHEPDNRDFGGVAAVKTVPHGPSEASSHARGIPHQTVVARSDRNRSDHGLRTQAPVTEGPSWLQSP